MVAPRGALTPIVTRNGSPMRTVSGTTVTPAFTGNGGAAVDRVAPCPRADAVNARRNESASAVRAIARSFPQPRLARAEEPEQRLHDSMIGAHRDLVDRETSQQMPSAIGLPADLVLKLGADRRVARVDVE